MRIWSQENTQVRQINVNLDQVGKGDRKPTLSIYSNADENHKDTIPREREGQIGTTRALLTGQAWWVERKGQYPHEDRDNPQKEKKAKKLR